MAARLHWMVFALCALAAIAAVLSFTAGDWGFGIVWVLLVGLTSNIGLYLRKRSRPQS